MKTPNGQEKKKGKKITVNVVCEDMDSDTEIEVKIKVLKEENKTDLVDPSEVNSQYVSEEKKEESTKELIEKPEAEVIDVSEEPKEKNVSKTVEKETKMLNKEDILLYSEEHREFTAEDLRQHFNIKEEKEKVRLNNILIKNIGKHWNRIGRGKYEVIKNKADEKLNDKEENSEKEIIP